MNYVPRVASIGQRPKIPVILPDTDDLVANVEGNATCDPARIVRIEGRKGLLGHVPAGEAGNCPTLAPTTAVLTTPITWPASLKTGPPLIPPGQSASTRKTGHARVLAGQGGCTSVMRASDP
jgi:hypothetical protein